MPRTFWQSYQSFLEEAKRWTGETGEQAVVESVRLQAKQDPQRFQEWVNSHGWGLAYVQRHLLYVADHPAQVRELLRRGYPLRRIPLRTLNLNELDQALIAPDWRTQVDRLFQRKPRDEWASKPVWLFGSTPELREREGLSASVAQALVERTCPPGGLVVDPMAGQGSIIRAALRTGRRAWGSDLSPLTDDVVQADIYELPRHVLEKSADVLVLHPPTFATWSRTAAELRSLPAAEHYAAYLDFIVGLLQVTCEVVKSGGQVVLIARPPRRGAVYLAPFELALGEHGLVLTAYHLAVSQDGHEDWHFFIARKA